MRFNPAVLLLLVPFLAAAKTRSSGNGGESGTIPEDPGDPNLPIGPIKGYEPEPLANGRPGTGLDKMGHNGFNALKALRIDATGFIFVYEGNLFQTWKGQRGNIWVGITWHEWLKKHGNEPSQWASWLGVVSGNLSA